MKRLAITLALLVPALVRAQFNNVGTSAANFLKIPIGSRAEAMGGAYSAVVSDPTAMYWNVAGLAHTAANELLFSQNRWIADLSHTFVGAVFRISDYDRLGLHVNYLDIGRMERTTVDEPKGTGATFSAYDFAVGVAYARQLTDVFSVGVQAKYVQQTISVSSASGLAFDVGLQYRSTWNDLRLAAAIQNFGGDLRILGDDLRINVDPHPNYGANPADVPVLLETKKYPLPISFQFGAAITPLRTGSVSLTGAVDVRDTRDFNQQVRAGIELGLMNMVFLRAGSGLFISERVVRSAEDNSSRVEIRASALRSGQARFSVGGGLAYTIPRSRLGLRFDYAYSFVETLNDVQRFTLSISF